MILKILMIGDTYARPGKDAVLYYVPKMKAAKEVDFVICNAENIADGSGLTAKIADELFAAGCDVLTCGDHVFDKRKDIEAKLNEDARLLRPGNFPEGLSGRSEGVYECMGYNLGVCHLAGQVFMRFHFSCPFLMVDEKLKQLKAKGARMILIDFHAEATSEKMAFSWYVDGRVSAVCGTHTHVQTADERVSAAGTAAITDLGMTGPYDSVIGAEKEAIIQRFLSKVGGKKQPAVHNVKLSGAIIHVDTLTNKAVHIERVLRAYPDEKCL